MHALALVCVAYTRTQCLRCPPGLAHHFITHQRPLPMHCPPRPRSPRNARPVSALSGVSQRERLRAQAHAPYKGSLLELYKRCKAADRWGREWGECLGTVAGVLGIGG